MSKIVLLICLLCSIAVSEQKTDDRISVDIGAGTTYAFYGVNITYDNDVWGGSVMISPYYFPYNGALALKINMYAAEGSIVLSPTLSVGHRQGRINQISDSMIKSTWVGLHLGVTGYISKSLYLQHQYGVERLIGEHCFLPHYGISIGYTFGGGIYSNKWYKENCIFNGVGFGLGTALPVAITLLCALFSVLD